mmetsp:Transcript_2085/g.6278  ORF Transcript_2085/g.6278 Transcript_2085/m.6278 type:complete len:363 (-) Transcript_2085:158-1246(-)
MASPTSRRSTATAGTTTTTSTTATSSTRRRCSPARTRSGATITAEVSRLCYGTSRRGCPRLAALWTRICPQRNRREIRYFQLRGTRTGSTGTAGRRGSSRRGTARARRAAARPSTPTTPSRSTASRRTTSRSSAGAGSCSPWRPRRCRPTTTCRGTRRSTSRRSPRTAWYVHMGFRLRLRLGLTVEPEPKRNPYMSLTPKVGNLGAADATASTWFGDKPEYLHGIQALPVTPFTETLFDKDYVKEELPVLADALDMEVEPFWKAILGQIQAMADPKLGAETVDALADFGPGGSQAAAFYWLLTRDWGSAGDADVGAEREANAEADEQPDACLEVSSCRVLGLEGLCCPSGNGDVLGCCPMQN